MSRMADILSNEDERKTFRTFLEERRRHDLRPLNIWEAVHSLHQEYQDGCTPETSQDLLDLLDEQPGISEEHYDLSLEENRVIVMNVCCNKLEKSAHRQYTRFRFPH